MFEFLAYCNMCLEPHKNLRRRSWHLEVDNVLMANPIENMQVELVLSFIH